MSQPSRTAAEVTSEAATAALVPTQRHGGGLRGTEAQRWWTRTQRICPVTNFPISMIPYPPFRLRFRAEPGHDLVDGKSLALQLIIGERTEVRGYELQASDVPELDRYMQRYQLGRWRLSTDEALREQVQTARNPMARLQAQLKRERYQVDARRELVRLRAIQRARLSL
mmetsp:Transcript_42214/g.106320  ORF Transcript_42214/g.106320 Transcript_42214/m.106320 type:complete len:169 (+) Transcript_42214:70-576(+)|eukprot:CAMPEP_0115329668 /NCGR_PEP_ID=MMETSP0270-20121206/85355_1 /TAXON_ID=71861 /ORGANISM="Scrippsiella trochoidea, Strain CCMP3099" /LENGTH=168 /DNA_ID=CAMNT_0002750309 /DNA_START=55 /DNA_END=561 /DNA_ORIENTATION=+